MTAGALILSNPTLGEEIRRWSLAAAIICAAHGGLTAGYLLFPPAEPEGSAMSPAVIVELAPMPVAPASQQDLAPGPDMVEAQPTPKPPAPDPPAPELGQSIAYHIAFGARMSTGSAGRGFTPKRSPGD